MNDEKPIEELIRDWQESVGLEFFRIHTEIRERHDLRSVEPLIEMLGKNVYKYDDNADDIIDLLCNLRDPRAIFPIINALHRVDFKAAVGIMVFGKQALQPIIDALKSEHWLTRYNAAYLLSCKPMIDEQSIQPLLHVALNKDENFGVRSSAMNALERIGDKRAIKPLSSLLTDEDEKLKKRATETIEGIKQSSIK